MQEVCSYMQTQSRKCMHSVLPPFDPKYMSIASVTNENPRLRAAAKQIQTRAYTIELLQLQKAS